MSSVVRLALHPEEHGKVTPLEVLRDFADATTDWVYLEDESQHYSEVKNTPGVVLGHRIEPSVYVHLGFVESPTTADTVELAVLDRPDLDTTLSPDRRRNLVDAFLDAIREYLNERPDHVTLHVEHDGASPTSS